MTADRPGPVRVALETGQRRCFAIAVDWPGWARSGRGEEAALAALADYAPRYARIAAAAGTRLPDLDADGDPAEAAGARGGFAVVQRVPGDATTDFGAPSIEVDADREPLDAPAADAVIALIEQSWQLLADLAVTAPESLRKGPRGGGRDRDAVIAHVVEAEVAYARKADVRLPRGAGRGPAAIADLRGRLVQAIRAGLPTGRPLAAGGWTPRYAARRIAWHVLDHAWEIEDRS